MVVHIPFRKVPLDVASAPAPYPAAERTDRTSGTTSPISDSSTGNQGVPGSVVRLASLPDRKEDEL